MLPKALKKTLEAIARGETDIALMSDSKLDLLWLSDDNLGDLANALRGSEVTELRLYTDKIHDDNIDILTDVLPETRIRLLTLRDTGITDFGVAMMLPSLRNSHVTNVDLPQKVVGDFAARLGKVLEDNKAKLIAENTPTPEVASAEQPTTTINAAEIIERQRRAALDEGQGI